MKILKTILAAMLCACLLSSCQQTENDLPDESNEAVTAEAAIPVTLIDASVGQDYVLVRSDISNSFALDKARQIAEAIKNEIGYEPALKTDWYKDSMGFPPTPHEILIGTTNREETAAVEAAWRSSGIKDWTVRLVGEKLVVYGGSNEALDVAVEYLLTNYLKDGSLTVPQGLNYTYTHEWAMKDILLNGRSITEYQIVIPTDGGDFLTGIAEQLQTYLTESIGYVPKIVKDTITREQTEYEILIGDTIRTVDLPAVSGDYYSAVSGTKFLLNGNGDMALASAVQSFIHGEAGTTKDGVYSVTETKSYELNLLSEAVLSVFHEATDLRAESGAAAVLRQHEKSYTATDLLNTDIYGNNAIFVLTMPREKLSDKAIEYANIVVQKVTGFMTTDIPQSAINSGGVDGECDFAANRLCRVFYLEDPSLLTEETMAKVRDFFLKNNFASRHFSENHMFMFRVARYLAGYAMPDETFRAYKATGKELYEEDKAYITEFLQYRARRGWAEFDSQGYGVEDFLSLINLYDCAPDDDIKLLAQMSMDSWFLSYMADCTNNAVSGGAHGRNYANVTTNTASGIGVLYKLYFGNDNPAEYVDMPSSSAPFLYTSDYRPHDVLYALAADKVYPYESLERVHNHTLDWTPRENGSINKYTYNTELYSIGSVNQQDPFPASSPDAWYEEHQQTNWSLAFAENPKAAITTHHPGGTSLHEYWYGDTECECNHLFSHENVTMGIYYIPGNAGRTYNFIHAWVPQKQFTEVVEQPDNNRLFVRLNDAYAALTFSESYAWAADNANEVKIYEGENFRNIRIAMACEAGDAATYGSFEKFIEAISKKEFAFDKEKLSLTYGNMKYELTGSSKRPEEHSYLDGKEIAYPYANTYSTPFFSSVWDSGVMKATYGDTVLTMDFMKITSSVAKE